LHCLWKQNIEVKYRAAAARVNQAHQLFAERATGGDSTRPVELQLVREALVGFESVAKDLRLMHVLRKVARTWRPGCRDIGERKYWLTWLRRDAFRQPLIFLRRSKRHEYRKSVEVLVEANQLLRFLIGSKPGSVPGTGTAGKDNELSFDITTSLNAIMRLIRQRRIGWLAHWAAACYFSRAGQISGPDEEIWREYVRQSREQSPLGWPIGSEVANWREYCEMMAIGEIGRVLRNPCHQLNPELLLTDPDMRPLHNALKGGMVSVLIGPMPDLDKIGIRPGDRSHAGLDGGRRRQAAGLQAGTRQQPE
jgi:hypothetical protein